MARTPAGIIGELRKNGIPIYKRPEPKRREPGRSGIKASGGRRFGGNILVSWLNIPSDDQGRQKAVLERVRGLLEERGMTAEFLNNGVDLKVRNPTERELEIQHRNPTGHVCSGVG